MLKVRICDDLEEGRHIWQKIWPEENIFDFWALRACFQQSFNRRPYFIVAETNGSVEGVLALSWIEETGCFGHFPGETWYGETWLEQNRIPARDERVFQTLLSHIPDAAHIRYLTRDSLVFNRKEPDVDETGYLFFPGLLGYSFQGYLQQFSGKSRKKLRRELDRLQAPGLSYRHDCTSDMELMFRMNLEAFGEHSYYSDARFLESFEDLMAWLKANNMLRVTTVMLGGKVAAVDVGAVWNSSHTVLAGGTHPDFPGVAKLINLHHIERACRERLEVVDFLCGDFGWKERFHLTTRPLYRVHVPQEQAVGREGCDCGIPISHAA